jgi:hypothetical protein
MPTTSPSRAVSEVIRHIRSTERPLVAVLAGSRLGVLDEIGPWLRDYQRDAMRDVGTFRKMATISTDDLGAIDVEVMPPRRPHPTVWMHPDDLERLRNPPIDVVVSGRRAGKSRTAFLRLCESAGIDPADASDLLDAIGRGEPPEVLDRMAREHVARRINAGTMPGFADVTGALPYAKPTAKRRRWRPFR